MLPLLLLLVTTQVPCTPSETTMVCHCKQGVVSACEALRQIDPKLANVIETALQATRLAEEARRKAAEFEAEASSSEPEPPDCKGQNHHVISRLIARELTTRSSARPSPSTSEKAALALSAVTPLVCCRGCRPTEAIWSCMAMSQVTW